MSNLGGYQILTTVAKKVGGPAKLIALIATGSAAVGALGYKGSEIVIKKIIASIKKQPTGSSEIIYKVTVPGESSEGLKFEIGNEFRVLETDGDAILIEKIGDKTNPYFVDKKLLNQISNFNN